MAIKRFDECVEQVEIGINSLGRDPYKKIKPPANASGSL
jgi:hypothetical protein